MSYSRERDEFISKATREGLSLDTCRKLLRYATTLHRLAEAQCNGDWPFNGDRDYATRNAREDAGYTTCPKCEASGVAKSAMRKSNFQLQPFDPRYVQKVCPDCRTQELVSALVPVMSNEYWKAKDLATHNLDWTPRTDYAIKPIFNGDPRGAVLRLETPNYPYSDNGSKGYGLYVPARTR